MQGRVQQESEAAAAAAERSSCTCTAGCGPDHGRNGDGSSCEMIMIGGDHDDIMQEALPPGFRFHPTEEELVGFYLRRRAAGLRLPARVIPDVDLYKHEPWELPDLSPLPSSYSYAQWFFFNFTDRKYPSGPRANRATLCGYWKATGLHPYIPPFVPPAVTAPSLHPAIRPTAPLRPKPYVASKKHLSSILVAPPMANAPRGSCTNSTSHQLIVPRLLHHHLTAFPSKLCFAE
ncbi:hypothetical protein L7F22_053345 [Adiantum nelumboides]|nr:hypothetical protein [Adiantum nelumboides]